MTVSPVEKREKDISKNLLRMGWSEFHISRVAIDDIFSKNEVLKKAAHRMKGVSLSLNLSNVKYHISRIIPKNSNVIRWFLLLLGRL